jgi:hypothetical protein
MATIDLEPVDISWHIPEVLDFPCDGGDGLLLFKEDLLRLISP